MSPPRILVAEAREEAADWLIARALRPAPEHLEQVETWSKLLEAIANKRWDVVLLDCELPGFEITQASRWLRDVGAEVPVILVSWGLGEGGAVAAMKAGASDCVLKSELERVRPAVAQGLREASERRARRLLEETLRASELHFRSLLGRTSDILLTLGLELERSGRLDPRDPRREAAENIRWILRELEALTRLDDECRGPRRVKALSAEAIRR